MKFAWWAEFGFAAGSVALQNPADTFEDDSTTAFLE